MAYVVSSKGVRWISIQGKALANDASGTLHSRTHECEYPQSPKHLRLARPTGITGHVLPQRALEWAAGQLTFPPSDVQSGARTGFAG